MMMLKTNELMRMFVAVAAGFLGAQIRVNSVQVEAAQNNVVRASRFELIAKSGSTLAYWASEDGRRPALHFLDERGHEVAVLGLPDLTCQVWTSADRTRRSVLPFGSRETTASLF
jgi:hypothetical protein